MAHPVVKITQCRPYGTLSGRRYGSFASKGSAPSLPLIIVSVSGYGDQVTVTGYGDQVAVSGFGDNITTSGGIG